MPTRIAFARLLVASYAAVLVVGVAGCGDDDEPTASGDGTTTTESSDTGGPDYGGATGGTPAADDGAIVAADFSLTDITVAPGAEIVLKNEGEQTHTATSDEEGLFDLGEVAGGETSEPGTAPDEPGSYTFHCEIHDAMTATLTVEG